MPRLTRSLRAVSGLLAATLATGALALVAASPASATPVPHTPSGLPRAIEPMAQYVGQTACDPYTHGGTKNLARLLARTYGSYGGAGYNTSYSCGTDGSRSEHYDGRAIDWMVSVRNAKQYAAAKAAISWLLATDSHGNRFAMARRLGVMYLIYNNRMWGAWDGKWEQYNGCYKLKSHAYDNSCHRTHVHISLSFNGALGHTSFWQKKVWPTNYGPCRPRDLNWAYRYTSANYRGCASYPAVHAKSSASSVKKGLVKWSGADVGHTWRGPAVSAVQRAFHFSQTGYYSQALANRVKAFQRKHRGCPVTGAMNQQTWRALLKVTR